MAGSDWYRRVMSACGAFLVLSVAAMALYPGGRLGDANSDGYAFFTNFFSDLGQTQTHSGAANLPSLALFCIALVAVAAGMSTFFIVFTQMFAPRRRGLATAAAVSGCTSAVCFLGVAATPWNLYLSAHNVFVTWAFQLFLLAVVADLIAVLASRSVPNRFALVFALFAIVLGAYIALLQMGPRLTTPEGAAIQATGQKIIVYASMLTIFVQSLLARRLGARALGT